MKICERCKGEGRITGPPAYPPRRTEYTYIDCPKCGGTGDAQQMIFWPYDQFPFLLAAPGTLKDDGTAYVPSYQGSFRPAKVMPMKEGKELAAKLKALAAEQDMAVAAVRAGFRARLNEIAPWATKK